MKSFDTACSELFSLLLNKLQDGVLLPLPYKRTGERHAINKECLKHSDSYVKKCWRNSTGRMVNTEQGQSSVS